MIIVKIQGGLGNQIRQYVMGKIISHYTQQHFFLDLGWFKIGNRNYDLDKFNIKQNVLNIKKEDLFDDFTIYADENANSLTSIQGENIYLDGYWGGHFSECKVLYNQFFLEQNEFTLKEDWNPDDQIIIDKMRQNTSVMVHIRRGDYITQFSHYFYNIPLSEYYDKLKKIQESYDNLEIYLFSDDMEWVKKNFKIDLPCYYINHNAGKYDYKDLLLMSYCRIFILANSSFSDVASWLAINPDKIIVPPSRIYV